MTVDANPVHIVVEPDAKRVVCGLKRDRISTVWIEAAPRHQYAIERCTECFTAAGLAWMLDPDLSMDAQKSPQPEG